MTPGPRKTPPPPPRRRGGPAVPPPQWTPEQPEEARKQAIENFRRERMQEPLEAYLELFEQYQGTMEDLMEKTVDLTQIEQNAIEILSDPDTLDAFRYLAGPPISLDDLLVLAEAESLSASRLRADPELVKRVIGTILTGLDRGRFPWVRDGGQPTEAEKQAAVIASAALRATQRVATDRRNEGKKAQEDRVKAALTAHGFHEVATRRIDTVSDAPAPGEFCGECQFGTRKADLVVRLWDQRVLPLECKVSNSATNSIKRLNNDAAVKAVSWRREFGELQVVPAAVLSGVFKMQHLESAQQRGLTILWAHDLDLLMNWIDSTKPKAK